MTSSTEGPWVARPSRGRAVVVVVLAGVFAAAAVVFGAFLWVDRSVDRVGVDGLGEGGIGDPAEASEQDGDDPDALTVLVLGSDSRAVLSSEERRELGTGDAEGERTEVIALTRLDPASDEIRVLSIPRDSLVDRCDGSQGRVNAAYGIGERVEEGAGASCVVETLRSWLGVRIDHVVKVDFRGFVDIVDALGGVSMYLEEPMRDRRANLDLEAGCQELDGAQSLAFVRARSIDDDFGRIRRQHRFVTELRDELADRGVLSDLPQLLRVAEATARAVELDDTLTLNRIQQLVRRYRDTLGGDIDSRTLPGEVELTDGFAFLRIDETRARELVRWLVTGRDVAEIREQLQDRDDDDDTDEVAEDEGGNGADGEDGADDDQGKADGPGPHERC